MRRRVFLSWLAAAIAGCRTPEPQSPGMPPTAVPSPRPASLFLTPVPAIEAVVFPRDYGSHDVLTEWWYYTGHLVTRVQERFGFEFVIFQVQRYGYPVLYAAHAALTLIDRHAFRWDERAIALPSRQASWPLHLTVSDWMLESDGSVDRLFARSHAFSLQLTLTPQRPPILHDGDGYFTWAPETGSYYYSRTRLSVDGMVLLDGDTLTVSGLAWNDHQWGNFLLGTGGWDWFGLQLHDGTDLMLWQSRDARQRPIQSSGTLVHPDGSVETLDAQRLRIVVDGTWTSPHSGATYPSGWRIVVHSDELELVVTPFVLDQELQTIRSTGVIYWEGAVDVRGRRRSDPVEGSGYVELTGYAAPPSP
ncbi:MAG: hypothetical protein NZ696_01115 [Thermomicrobium sp.]|nr:hypothetical protein [Thermomicrobium sp.]MDW7982327.1 lipocalin family protein [Thermomicrobium sp.]